MRGRWGLNSPIFFALSQILFVLQPCHYSKLLSTKKLLFLEQNLGVSIHRVLLQLKYAFNNLSYGYEITLKLNQEIINRAKEYATD